MTLERESFVDAPANGSIYVVEGKILPGDVLLTLGDAAHSAGIALSTGGAFSHAAMFETPYILFESLAKDGVGRTRLFVTRIEEDGSSYELLSQLPGVRRAVVGRHPALAAFGRDKFFELHRCILLAEKYYLGLEYPAFHRLGSALPEDSALKRLHTALQGPLERALPPAEYEGPFCSALIVDMFARLGVPLFDQRRMADSVSPSALAATELVAVEGAVVAREAVPMGDAKEIEAINANRRAYPTRQREIEGRRAWWGAMSLAQDYVLAVAKLDREFDRLRRQFERPGD